ncbi:MAG: MFS transporter [Sedimentibacter sp.]
MDSTNFEKEKKEVLHYRWIIYFLLAMVYFLSNFHKFSAGVMQDELIDSFHLSTAAFGNLSSMIFYSYLIMQIPTGILVDNLGPRKTVTLGCLVTALGSVMFAVSQVDMMANISRFIIGIGISVSYISLIKIQTNWFRSREFATMTGITFLIGNLGSVLAQTPLRLLVEAFSWRSIYLAFGAISAFMGLLVYIVVRNSPEDMGLISIDLIEGKNHAAVENQNKEKIKITKSLKNIVLNHYNWSTLAVVFSLGAITSILSGSFGAVYIRDTYKIPLLDASKFTMILTLGLAIGSTIIGYLSDYFRRRKIFMLILISTMNLIWIYIVLICKGRPGIEVLKMLYFLTGVSLSSCLLSYTVAKEYNKLNIAGMATSCLGLLEFIGSALGPVIVGKLIDINSTLYSGGELYSKAFIVLVFCNVIAFVGTILVKETKGENIYDEILLESKIE